MRPVRRSLGEAGSTCSHEPRTVLSGRKKDGGGCGLGCGHVNKHFLILIQYYNQIILIANAW